MNYRKFVICLVMTILMSLLLCSTCFAWDPSDYTEFIAEQIEGENKIQVFTYSTWLGPDNKWPIRTDDESDGGMWNATVTAYNESEEELGTIEVPEEAEGVVDYSDYVLQGIKYIRVTQGSGADSDFIEVVVTTYTITLMSDGQVYKTETVLPGQILNEVAALVKENFTFQGWYEDEEFTNAVSFPYTVTGDATFYAKWAAGPDLTAYYKALGAVKEEDYTPESWAAYQKIVEANKVTAANSQEEIDAATAAILAAQKNLVFAGKADLLAAVARAEKLNKNDYTKESWSALEAALAMPESSNAEVVAKTKAINEAIDNLKRVATDDKTDTSLPKTGSSPLLFYLAGLTMVGIGAFMYKKNAGPMSL